MSELKQHLIRLGYQSPELRPHLRSILDKIAGQSMIVYHGTSTKFLRDILKKGLIPNPKDQRWGPDRDSERRAIQPVATLDGYVYLTDSPYYARDFALDAAATFGGNPLIVVAQISPQSAAVDHDDLTGPVRDDASILARQIAPDDVKDYHSWLLGYMLGVETAEQIRIGKKYGKSLADYIGAENEDVLSYEVPGRGIQASLPTSLLMMYLVMYHRKRGNEASLNNGFVHAQKDYWPSRGYDSVVENDPSEWDEEDREEVRYQLEKSKRMWPMSEDTATIEKEWKKTIRNVSERLSGAIGSERSRVKGMMIEGRINYRGSNRILALLEVDETPTGAEGVKIHYNAMGTHKILDLIEEKMFKGKNMKIEFSG